MKIRIELIVSLLAAGMTAGTANAALQGRDLDGNMATYEAYYDTELDVTWLADANFARTSGFHQTGALTWYEANDWAAALSFTNGVRVYDNWRLPDVKPLNGTAFDYTPSLNGSTDRGYNVSAPGSASSGSKQSEIAYLFYNTLGNKSICKPETSTFGCDGPQPGWGDFNSGPFSSVNISSFWTATSYDAAAGEAWDFDFYGGAQGSNLRGARFYAWALTDGDVAAVPEGDTWAMMLAGLGLIGVLARRRCQD